MPAKKQLAALDEMATHREKSEPLSENEMATKQPFGSHPANLYEAPIATKGPEQEPPNPYKNKYGRYDDPISPEVDAEIERLWNEGRDTRSISQTLLEQLGIKMDYKRVRGRMSVITRRRSKSKVKTEVENEVERSSMPKNAAELRLPSESPQIPIAKADLEGDPAAANPPPKSISRASLNGMIWDMHRAGESSAEISDELCKQGYYYSEGSVTSRLKNIEEGRG